MQRSLSGFIWGSPGVCSCRSQLDSSDSVLSCSLALSLSHSHSISQSSAQCSNQRDTRHRCHSSSSFCCFCFLAAAAANSCVMLCFPFCSACCALRFLSLLAACTPSRESTIDPRRAASSSLAGPAFAGTGEPFFTCYAFSLACSCVAGSTANRHIA